MDDDKMMEEEGWAIEGRAKEEEERAMEEERAVE